MRYAICAVLIIWASPSARAQTIQQPVVGTTSVNTTVSVPDRGSTFLGGVSSAQSGRSQYGPLPTGPSTGLTRQASSMSVSVHIHDLQAMDEAILNSTPSPAEPRRIGMTSARPSNPAPVELVVSAAEKAKKFELLARKADDAGKASVAKLHWQMAARYGSKAAEEKLAQLPQSSTTEPSRTANR